MNYKKTYWKTLFPLCHGGLHWPIREEGENTYIMIDEDYKRHFYRRGIGWIKYEPISDELNWRMISEEDLILELL